MIFVNLIPTIPNKLQVKASVKTQGGEGEDPDSRMDSERADRRDKKGGKGKVSIFAFLPFFHFCIFGVAPSQIAFVCSE